GAGRSLLYDGRQPRQFDRQPGAQPGRLRAAGEPRRPRADHLLLHCGGRARLGIVEVAVVGALEQAVLDRKMSRRRKRDTSPETPREPAANGAEAAAAFPIPNEAAPVKAPDPPKERAPKERAPKERAPKERKRRHRGTAGFEERIGYRFKNAALLEQALTH